MAPVAKRAIRYFISYTREDGNIPNQFLSELHSQLSASSAYEFHPWRDTQILPGENWHSEIQQALAECDFGLLLISPAFLGKPYIKEQELPHFVAHTKPCLPVMLRKVDLNTQDLRGLEPSQLFTFSPPRGQQRPRSFQECSTAAHRTAFAHDLFKKIVARLDKLLISPITMVEATNCRALSGITAGTMALTRRTLCQTTNRIWST